jgi:hypothetical protein
VAAVTHELADAGRFDSAAGQQAVELARQMVAPWQFGSVVAAPQASGHRRLRVGLLCRPIAGGGMCGSDGPPQAHHPTLVERGPRSHWSFRRRTSPDDFLATEAQGLPFSLVDRLVAVCANVERLPFEFRHVGVFQGGVVHLVPGRAEPFHELARRCASIPTIDGASPITAMTCLGMREVFRRGTLTPRCRGQSLCRSVRSAAGVPWAAAISAADVSPL